MQCHLHQSEKMYLLPRKTLAQCYCQFNVFPFSNAQSTEPNWSIMYFNLCVCLGYSVLPTVFCISGN